MMFTIRQVGDDMKTKLKRKPVIQFKYNDYTKIPDEIIEEAPSEGPFDDYATYLIGAYDIDATIEETKKYLRSLGAWSQDELNDHYLNLQRLLWVSIQDCKENNTNFWYMGI